MNISEKIKEIREAKRFTQRELAENLSMTIGNYQKIEAGSVSITFDRLQQIADVFQMSVVEIIEYPNGKDNAGVSEERVKELEKEIVELRSWLKDKDLIISFLEKNNVKSLHEIVDNTDTREFLEKINDAAKKLGEKNTANALNELIEQMVMNHDKARAKAIQDEGNPNKGAN